MRTAGNPSCYIFLGFYVNKVEPIFLFRMLHFLQILNPESDTMSMITENASEEFLYALNLSNYGELQVGESKHFNAGYTFLMGTLICKHDSVFLRDTFFDLNDVKHYGIA